MQKAIAAGADPNATSAHGSRSYTPLKATANFDNKDAIRALCEAGADGDMPGTARPPHYAADGEAVALLFDCGGLVWATDSNDLAPLHYAAGDNRFSAMEALNRRGADPDAGDKFGNTPLHDAARYGHPTAVQILLAGGAGINATNIGDVTPLYRAAMLNAPEVIEVLLDAGADPAIRDEDGLYPADVATKHNRRLRGHPVMTRLEAGMTTAGEAVATAPGCDGHLVQAPDRRLGDVAQITPGQRSRWPEIARLNGITAEAPRLVGQCLALP